jgi:hypothetical protein
LLHRIGHDAVDSDSRQSEREGAEDAEEPGAETRSRRLIGYLFRHRRDLIGGQIRIEFLQDAAHGRDQAVRIDAGARRQEQISDGRLRQGHVDIRVGVRILRQPAIFDLSDHADD